MHVDEPRAQRRSNLPLHQVYYYYYDDYYYGCPTW